MCRNKLWVQSLKSNFYTSIYQEYQRHEHSSCIIHFKCCIIPTRLRDCYTDLGNYFLLLTNISFLMVNAHIALVLKYSIVTEWLRCPSWCSIMSSPRMMCDFSGSPCPLDFGLGTRPWKKRIYVINVLWPNQCWKR